MKDGTGTTKYTYDQLDRLTETEDGHGEKVTKYEYDLANEQHRRSPTPTAKASPVHLRQRRTAGKAHRLALAHHKIHLRPRLATSADDISRADDRRRQVRLQRRRPDERNQDAEGHGNARLARLHSRQRRPGQQRPPAKAYRAKKTPNTNTTEQPPRQSRQHCLRIRRRQQPDQDSAPAPTNTTPPTSSKPGPSLTYSYNEVGQRTKTTPCQRPRHHLRLRSGREPDLSRTPQRRRNHRRSKTPTPTTATTYAPPRPSQAPPRYLAWDTHRSLPLLLSDGTNSYIYGPDDLPIEQINTDEPPPTSTTTNKAPHACSPAPPAPSQACTTPTPTATRPAAPGPDDAVRLRRPIHQLRHGTHLSAGTSLRSRDGAVLESRSNFQHHDGTVLLRER